MTITLEQLLNWMNSRENEHLEFKEARTQFEFEKLVKYCVALANERGGHLILGISDKQPRTVVGTQAFADLDEAKTGLFKQLQLRVEAEVVSHPDGRVIVFTVPSRATGVPMQYKGAYLMRSGEQLVPMTADVLKRIFAESSIDFSAQVCEGATLADLDPAAIAVFRNLWLRKTGNQALAKMTDEQLLGAAELIQDRRVLYAALILFGTTQALTRYLAQAEVIFEYRSGVASGPATERRNFRQGFFLFHETLWQLVNLRNDRQHFQNGLFMADVPTFSEVVIREAVLNAVSHRDYQHLGSVFVKQFPRRLEVISPGGFLPGITTDNILWQQLPRNRRIAEALERCGLIERAGQGMNRIYEECIKESKRTPDFTDTDDFQVSIGLEGTIDDPGFLRFLEQVGRERTASFDTSDFLALDCIHRDKPIPESCKERLPALVNQGIIERIGRGRGVRYILSGRFYQFLNQKGTHTRKVGLDRDTNKQLLLQHIRKNNSVGCQLHEFAQVLPALSRESIQALIRELKEDGLVHNVGRTKGSRWYLGRRPESE